LDEGDRVTRLLVTADTVRAATGQLLYASSDGCTTFHEEDPFHEVAVYDAGGGTSDGPSNAYVGLVDGGGYTLTAGYRGAVLRTPTFGWHSARLLDAAFVRAFQIANTDGDEPDALHLWVTSYGGGLLDMAGGGATFRTAGPTGTLEGLFGRDVGRRASGDLVYAGDLYAYASADEGETLRRVDVHTDHLLGVRSAGGRSWALGARGSSGALSTSMDGLTWTPVDLGGAWPTDIAGRVLDGEDVVVARLTTPSGVAYTADAGASWTSLGSTATEVLGFATWPPGVGTTLVRSAGDGVSRSTDHGVSWVPASVQPDLPPARLLVTGADGIVGFDGAGRLWQSTDGGDTWAQRGTALPSPQDWLEWQDRLVVATVRGLVWSDDLGDTWRSAPFVDDLTPLHEALVCLDTFGAVVSCADRLTPGVRVRFSTRAARFTVATDPPLSFDVQVGGASLGAGSSGHLFELPAAAWSDVDLTVTNGFATLEGVRGEIDGERILGAGYVNDNGDSGETGGGDTGGSGDGDSGDSADNDSADSAGGHSPADADTDTDADAHNDTGCACGLGGDRGAGLGVGWLLALALVRRRAPMP
jgi:hypothetical protein